MASKRKQTTTILTAGKVALPKAILERRHWSAGTELIVEEMPDGVLLKAPPVFPLTRPKDVFGSLSYEGPAQSVADMKAAISAEAKRRRARHRY